MLHSLQRILSWLPLFATCGRLHGQLLASLNLDADELLDLGGVGVSLFESWVVEGLVRGGTGLRVGVNLTGSTTDLFDLLKRFEGILTYDAPVNDITHSVRRNKYSMSMRIRIELPIHHLDRMCMHHRVSYGE